MVVELWLETKWIFNGDLMEVVVRGGGRVTISVVGSGSGFTRGPIKVGRRVDVEAVAVLGGSWHLSGGCFVTARTTAVRLRLGLQGASFGLLPGRLCAFYNIILQSKRLV